jgi:hypothetical protein
MGLTIFPHGTASFGIPQVGNDGLIPTSSGSYFWVDSGPGRNGQGTFEDPFSTIENAYSACTASAGDVIVVKEGHTQTISSATGVVLNKIGVSIVGLGSGSLRPTFTLSGTAATCTFTVSAASQTIKNIIVTSGVVELVSAFTVSAAGCSLIGIDYRETATANTVLAAVTGTAGADYLTIKNCMFKSTTTAAGNASCIVGVAAQNDVVIANNIIEWIGADNAATCAIYNAGAGLRWLIAYNIFKITGGTSVTVVNATTCTGMAIYNSSGSAGTTLASNFQFDGGYSVQNLVTDTVNTNGIPDPILVT